MKWPVPLGQARFGLAPEAETACFRTRATSSRCMWLPQIRKTGTQAAKKVKGPHLRPKVSTRKAGGFLFGRQPYD